MKTDKAEAFLTKAVCTELDALRKTFREVIRSYTARLESELDKARESVAAMDDGKKLPLSRIHDLRDMLTLLRKLEVKPAKGRRRDLKKIESTFDDLRDLAKS